VWFEKNKNSLNLKFKSYNTSCMGQTCKDFIQASEIHSELLFRHCSCYSDTRGVIHIFDSNSNVSDVSSPKSLSLRVIELENAHCNQDKLLYKIFHENKKLNLELESIFSEIASLQSAHDDMSDKPCDNCNMIMVNYVDL
jgi:hypothetical protein